jgi:large subunit ribosomal protein L20
MIRIKRGNIARIRHKKILKLTKGFFSAHSRLFRIANSKVLISFTNSYIGRKQKKRNFRRLWIVRINAALNTINFSNTYSIVADKFKNQKIILNRKILSQLTILDPLTFKFLILHIFNNKKN